MLSNLYFCIGWYSRFTVVIIHSAVVICFQICIFVLVDTAKPLESRLYVLLWFAFKFVFLYWLIQRSFFNITIENRCDLLSNLYFCLGWYSPQKVAMQLHCVVICFQICIFVLVDTAGRGRKVLQGELWFAFKFVFLYWLIQLRITFSSRQGGCDLLSNLYFCIGWYSKILFVYLARAVVICFQICIFVLVDTATGVMKNQFGLLWFAFKFVFLYWLIQLLMRVNGLRCRCDLLSNLYFCIGWYSTTRSTQWFTRH